jgi:flavin reductase
VTTSDAAPAPVPDAVRQAMGQFVTGIAVVAVTTGGVTHALAASSFTSVSLDPLLVLVCLDRAAPRHDPVISADTWAVSILSEEHEPTARRLTPRGGPLDPALTAGAGPLDAQLNGHPHHPGPITGHPILADALAALECRTYAVHPGGDHTILIGQVLSAVGPTAPEVPGPLLFHAGRYRRLPTR